MKQSKTIIKPWGKFEQFTHNEQTTIKIITVNQNHRLSKQKHKNRDELWIALDGGLIAEIDNKTIELKKGDKVFIPRNTFHRISANKNVKYSARFLEIAYGEFDENDIERIEDDYGRI